MTIRTLKDIPRGIFLLLLVLVAGPIAFQSCAISPIMTTENERRIGAEAAKQVEQTMGLVDTPELGSYLEAVGGRLAAHSPRNDLDYTFRIVDMKEPNAFALPGGYTFFSRGLLALVNSEEDLAKRVNGAWSLEQIAVANGLSSRDTLKTNQKIKVAVYETYKIKKTKEKN